MNQSVESIIAAAIAAHEAELDAAGDCWTGLCVCGHRIVDDGRGIEEAHAAHQAAAVMAALVEVGAVEWGVQWPFQDADFKPLEVVTRAAGEATAASLAKITPAPQHPPVIVSRLTLPWQEVEA